MASIRKRPNGKYEVQVRIQGMRSISRTFSTKKLAIQFVREVEGDSELARKLGVPVTRTLTFRQLSDMYMEQYLGKDASTSGRLDFWCCHFGNRQTTDIDALDVDAGLHELKGRGLTGSTINRYKSTLSAVFIFFCQHAEYKRVVQHLKFSNPVRQAIVSRFRENPAKDRFLSQEEQKNLLAACKGSHWNKLYLLVLMALTTGARKGEMLNLRWTDIDFRNRTAALGTTKNGKPKLLPLTQPVIQELMKFRENNDFLVFHSTVSRTMPFDIKKAWLKALRDSEIGHCRFHDLRHTAASNLVRAGRTLFEVGTLLGHSSTSMTARYAHLAVHDTQAMVDSVMGNLQ